MRRTTRRRAARAAEVIEFALVGPLVMALLLGIVTFGVSSWQRSSIDYELSTLSESLPQGWQADTDDELVRKLILADSKLNPEKLSVENASVTTRDDTEAVQDDAVARALGANVAYRQSQWVEISADVTYEATSGFDMAGPVTYRRHVSGSYLVQRRYEVS